MNILSILLAVKKAELAPDYAAAVTKNLCEASGEYTADALMAELFKLHAEACGVGDGESADYIRRVVDAFLSAVRRDLLGGR